jgi:serine protease Do
MKRTLPLLASLPVLCLLSYGSFAFADSAVQTIKERQTKVLNVVNQSGKAVVNLGGIGSGVVISKDGLILTAAHVVDALDSPVMNNQRKGDEYSVTLANGKEVKAKTLGCNRNRDAAIAQITTKGEYDFVDMADPTSIKQGAWCVAMGHPGGYFVDRSAPVRTGRLWKKDEKAYYRTDCTVSGGDSGGPLFDLEGKVIGIHSSISEQLFENRHVPVAAYQESMDRMMKGDKWGKLSKLMPELAPFERGHGGKSNSSDEDEDSTPAPRKAPEAKELPAGNRPLLGIGMENSDEGVVIGEVAPNSPAATAGLELDDIILKLDGKDISDADTVKETVGGRKPGDKIKLTVKRGDSTKEIEVTLGKR